MDADDKGTLDSLRQCCDRSGAAQILCGNEIYQSVFATVSAEAVTLRLLIDVSQDAFSSPSLCCVTFTDGQQTCVFLAGVRDYQPPTLTLELPEQVARANGRLVFRVPVFDSSGLLVQLTADNREWSPRPIEISLGGMLIEFPKPDVPDLSIGAELKVELRLDNVMVKLTSVVRHRLRQRYGISFSNVLHRGQINPPDELRSIVADLQIHWLRNRTC